MANIAKELVNAEHRYAELKLKVLVLGWSLDPIIAEHPGDVRGLARVAAELRAVLEVIAKHEAA